MVDGNAEPGRIGLSGSGPGNRSPEGEEQGCLRNADGGGFAFEIKEQLGPCEHGRMHDLG